MPTVADLDGDGFGELLFNINDTPRGFYLFPGSASGPGAPVLYSEGQFVSDLQVVDLDADGNLDVVTASFETRGVRVYYGNGTLALGSPSSVRMADPPQYLEVIDADADGRLDLVTTSPEYTSLFQPEITPHFVSVAYAAHPVATADLTLSVDCGGLVLVQGRTRSCEFTVGNPGPRPATDVVLTSGPQPFLTVVGQPTIPSGACATNQGDIAFRCDIPSLAVGATTVVTLDLAYNDEVTPRFSVYFRPAAYADTADRGVKNNRVELFFRTPDCTITGRDRLPDGTILGTEGADVICGTRFLDRIYGLGGDDLISANQDADVIDGGTGDDVVYGENGNDTLLGGDGDDVLFGGNGADTIDGGAGIDDCRPEAGVGPPVVGCP